MNTATLSLFRFLNLVMETTPTVIRRTLFLLHVSVLTGSLAVITGIIYQLTKEGGGAFSTTYLFEILYGVIYCALVGCFAFLTLIKEKKTFWVILFGIPAGILLACGVNLHFNIIRMHLPFSKETWDYGLGILFLIILLPRGGWEKPSPF